MKGHKNGSYFKFVDFFLLDQVQERGILQMKRFSFISTFISIFTTVVSSLEAFKCLPVSYVDLNETELGFTASE